MKEEIPEEFYEAWETLPVEVQNYLKKIVEESPSEEQFIKREGNDLMFMTCSRDCAKSLKKTLQNEKEIIDNINMKWI